MALWLASVLAHFRHVPRGRRSLLHPPRNSQLAVCLIARAPLFTVFILPILACNAGFYANEGLSRRNTCPMTSQWFSSAIENIVQALVPSHLGPASLLSEPCRTIRANKAAPLRKLANSGMDAVARMCRSGSRSNHAHGFGFRILLNPRSSHSTHSIEHDKCHIPDLPHISHGNAQGRGL